MTPETAITTFIQSKKQNQETPPIALETIKTYKKWNYVALKGLLNSSAYFPDILLHNGMEEDILKLLKGFQDREIKK